jgi:branched-chain amino acid transport system ATP-binding protein
MTENSNEALQASSNLDQVKGGNGSILVSQDVSKSFGGLMAVRDMSAEVSPGTITGLIGPNGAGKTTFFNIISGIYKADTGSIYFNGERIDHLPPHKIFHKGICRTFQITRELKLMTVLENLMLVPPNQLGENLFTTWLTPWRVRDQERESREKALEVLEFVNLIDLKDEYADNLSAGQKRLLEIARTMMADPQLLLLDEPGAGVNPTLLKHLVEYIQRLAFERGITIFLIEHDMDLVMNTCDPVIVMNTGQKLTEGSPEEIRRDQRVLEAYLGEQT